MRPEALIVLPHRGWSLEILADQIDLYHKKKYQITIAEISELKKRGPFETDILTATWWRWLSVGQLDFVKARMGVIGCIYDSWSWKYGAKPGTLIEAALNRMDVLCVANEGFASDLRRAFRRLPPMVIAPDCADMGLFDPGSPIPYPQKFTALWVGNAKTDQFTQEGNGDLKGLDLITKACALADVPLVKSELHGSFRPHRDMPDFYKQGHVLMVGSTSEGGPRPLAEALAMGRGVVTTRVGLASRLVQHGKTGVIVDRAVEPMVEGLRYMRRLMVEQGKAQAVGRAARLSARQVSASEVIPATWGTALGLLSEFADAPPPEPLALVPPPAVKPAKKPRVRIRKPRRKRPLGLLLSDVRGWAFNVGHLDLQARQKHWADFDHYFCGDFPGTPLPDMEWYDLVFRPYNRWRCDHLIPRDHLLGALRSSCWFGDDPDRPPGPAQFAIVNECRGFQVVTRRNYEELREHCPNVRYIPNPVNMDRFPKTTDVKEVVALWSGNASRVTWNGQNVKGFHEFIEPGCKQAGVRLEIAEYKTARLPPEEMPAFYRRGSVLVMASLFEGHSKTLTESMASGLAVVSTDVGNISEMRENQLREFGDTGIILVERSAEAIADALSILKPARVREMGDMNRREVAERWSWELWAPEFEKFLRMALL